MSEICSTPSITRCGLADDIDRYDDEIAATQNAKRERYNVYRAELLKAGYEQADVRVEIEACKAAIKKRRAAAKNHQTVEERDALVDEIFEEISSPRARRATHAREDEAGSLSAYASSSEILEDRVNPDAVRQGRLSETEGASGRLEAPARVRRSIAAAPGTPPVARAGDPEMSLQSDPVESAEPEVEARVTYAVDPPRNPSDPGDIPACLRRTDGIRSAAAL
jgi:hypothetical protein